MLSYVEVEVVYFWFRYVEVEVLYFWFRYVEVEVLYFVLFAKMFDWLFGIGYSSNHPTPRNGQGAFVGEEGDRKETLIGRVGEGQIVDRQQGTQHK